MENDLGVVAVVPFWSQSDNLNADSNYAYLRMILPRMVEKTTNTIFLVFFPDPKYGRGKWNYTPDGLVSDRIRLISWPYDTQMRTSVLGFDTQRFADIDSKYAPTIYWLHQVESGAMMSGGYQQSFNYSARPTLVAQHHYIIHESLPYPFEGLFPRLWAQLGGSIASHHIVYNSHHCYNMAQESFGKYLNAQSMKELNDKSTILQFGLLMGNEPVAPIANDDDIPVFIYNHRFEAYKNPKVTGEVLERLKTKYKFRVWATQAAKQNTSHIAIDEIKFAADRVDYLRNIAVPAINTINSQHETFCISLLDSIMLGQLPVAPNSVTFPELVPEGYPFLFNNEEEQYEILDHILRTWPLEYNKWHDVLVEHAQTKFGVESYVDNYIKILYDAERPARLAKPKEHNAKGLNTIFDSLEKGKLYTPDDIRRMVSKKLGLGTQAFNNRRGIREALNMRNDIQLIWNSGVKLVRR